MAWQVIVEVAFTTAPLSTSPSWTDISAYVRLADDLDASFGRPDEFSDVQPAQLRLTLNNDGRFTRNNAASPYYPNVVPGKRIRVRAVRSAVSYTRFDGHVVEWPTAWPLHTSRYATAEVTAVDRLASAGAVGELRSMLEEETLRDTRSSVTTGATLLVDPPDSDFEGSIGNWTTGGGGTVAHTTEQAHSGSGSMKLTLDGTGSGMFAKPDGASFASAKAVTPGTDVLSGGAWFKAATNAAAADYDWIVGFFTDTDEHLELTDPALVPAGKLKAISLHWNVAGIAGRIAAIRAAHPDVKLLAYQNVGGMIAGPHTNNRPTTLVTQEQATAHGTGADDWRLHKESDGTVIVFNDFTYLQAAHIGRASWRTQATQHFAGIAADGFDGVFLDDLNMTPGHGFNEGDANDSTEFASDNAYRDAMVATCAVLKTAADANGLELVANIGLNPWEADPYAGYLAMLDAGSLHGVCREFWTNWGATTVYFDGATWTDTMKVLTDAEARGTWAMVNSYPLTSPDHTRSIRYGLASFYLHWNGTADSGFGYNDGGPVASIGEYRTLLGTPLEDKQLVSGTSTDGAWQRRYTGGIVCANAKSTVGTVTFTLGGTYLDPSGTPVTSVGLAATNGMVLLAPGGGAARTTQFAFRYLDSGNGWKADVTAPVVTPDDDGWVESRIEDSLVPTSPAGIAKVLPQVLTGNGTAAGEVFYTDDVWIEKAGTAGTQTATAAAYYPLSEPAEATTFTSITASAQGVGVIRQVGSGGEFAFAAGTGPGTDQLAAPLFTPASATSGLYLDTELHTPVGGGTKLTVSAWFRAEPGIVSRRIAALVGRTGTSLTLGINASGRLEARRTPSAAGYTIATTTSVNDDTTHHAVVTETQSGTTATTRLYLDGVERATATYPTTQLPVGSQLLIGGWPGAPDAYGLFHGTISHVAAISGVALPVARITDIYNAGATGLSGERTDQRIGRILDWLGVPTANRVLDVGDATVGGQACAGHQPVECMHEVEATEQGVLFVAEGNYTFHDRSRRYNTSPAATLSATGSVLGEAPTFRGDNFGLANDATGTWVGGQVRAVNTTSIDAYGLQRTSIATAAPSAAAAEGVVQWRVNAYGTPLVRVTDVVVNLARLEASNPSVIPTLLTATIGTRLRLSDLFAQAPAATVDVFVEGWAETISTRTWAIRFNCSPADPYQVWALGTAGFTELGVTTKLAP